MIEDNSPLNKEIYKNPTISYIVNSTINEWDIKSAYLVALKILYGIDNKKYKDIYELPKNEYKITIGKMMLKDKTLSSKIQKIIFDIKKTFIEKNNIKINNIIETTKDSIVLTQKIPNITSFKINDVDIEFSNKEGFYSSYYRISNMVSIFFDSMSCNIRIKGINNEIVQESIFVNKYLKKLLIMLESNITIGQLSCLKSMKSMRSEYINSDDINIYRVLNLKNKFIYNILGEIVESDVEMEESDDIELIKINNYLDFVVPLMKTVI